MSERKVTEGRRKMARIAALQGRLADLRQRSAAIGQEEAEIYAELATIHAGEAAGEPVDLRTRRKLRQPTRTPELPPVSEMDQARARKALQKNERRRRTTS